MTGGLAALLLLVPIALAYRRLPPRARRVVPSLVLLRRLEPGAVSARRARRIEDALLLALLSGALVALVVGLAATKDDRPAIVVLDGSPSMGAVAGDRTRIDRARSALTSWLDAHPDAPAGLLLTSEGALAISPTLDHSRVREAILTAPTRADRDWTALARESCRDARIVVASDGPHAAPASCDVTNVDLGSAEDNGGLVAVAVRPTDALGGIEVAVETLGTTGPLTASSEGVAFATLPIEKNELVTRITAPRGSFALSLPGGDALAADDRVQVARTPLVRVLLVTRDPGGFAARALDAHPGAALQIVAPTDPLPSDADVVFVEDAPDASLPEARISVWLGEVEGSGFAVKEVARDPIARGAASDWMRYVDPSAIHIASSIVFAPGPKVLLDSSRGPLAVARDSDGRATIALGFGPRTSDLGLDVAFLHFVANVVDAARPGTGAVEGVLSRDDTVAAAPPPTLQRARPVLWRWGAGAAFACLLAEGLFTHLARRRR
jgi:hypothetical protein